MWQVNQIIKPRRIMTMMMMISAAVTAIPVVVKKA
jgi:hypothetical protein